MLQTYHANKQTVIVIVLLVLFFQPAVCTRELCVFSFYTLGVMSEATEEVATGAEVGNTSMLNIQ